MNALANFPDVKPSISGQEVLSAALSERSGGVGMSHPFALSRLTGKVRRIDRYGSRFEATP
jgi:hypothetical protein